MPTPAVDSPSPPLHQLLASVIHHRPLRATCPPDEERPTAPLPRLSAISATVDGFTPADNHSPLASVHAEHLTSPSHAIAIPRPATLEDSETDGEILSDSSSSASASKEKKQQVTVSPVASPITPSAPFAPPLSNAELSIPRCAPRYKSSYLKAGSVFEGTQQSDRQVYNVQVELKHVDMAESFLCGYLRIEGLTAEHPTLTTYFEGEIIGTKYSFLTGHSEWGSNENVDKQHWNRFPAWRPLQRAARKVDFNFKNYAEREHVFMRWKEYFLVPDHRVRSISGASFEGFYYICFNQMTGTVSGIYFHSKSEKYQQLELKHVEDHGCTGALEFR